ncbi:MAG: hypothetical protein QXJ97_10930, partial [Desulfurococcaceae archaeon]
MKVEILAPPNETLLSSMLYEGYIRILGSCGEDPDESCMKEVLKNLKEKKVILKFAGKNDKSQLSKIQKKFKAHISTFQDLIGLFTTLKIQDLRIDVRLSDKKNAVFVGSPGFTKEEGYSFQ